MNVSIVDMDKFEKLVADPVIFTGIYDEAKFDSDWERLRDSLRKILSSRWTESWQDDGDFYVGDDRGNIWNVGGGIFNEDLVAFTFLNLVQRQIALSSHPEKWGTTWSIDCLDKQYKKYRVRGEIFLKNGQVYISKCKSFSWEYIAEKLSVL